MPYDHILQQFPLNLIAYYEKHAVINENDDKEEEQVRLISFLKLKKNSFIKNDIFYEKDRF